MSKEHAKKWYEHLNSSKEARDEVKGLFEQAQQVAAKHGYHFDLAEYFDMLHEETGMTKVGKSTNADHHPDTCFPFCLSETPRY